MSRFLILASLLAFATGSVWADSVVSGTFVSMPSSIANPGPGAGCGSAGASPSNPSSQCGYNGTGPYWDNDSGKGASMNIGYVLTGSCSIGADCTTDLDPTGYLSTGAGSYAEPSSITLGDVGASSIELLSALSGSAGPGGGTDVFGYYNVSAPGTLIPLWGPGAMTGDLGDSMSLSDLVASTDYGFYLTTGCFAHCVGDATTVTLYSNDALNSFATLTGDQFFTIFSTGTNGTYYVSVEDFGLIGGTANGEGNGDYSDIVFKLTTTESSAIPEPATYGLIGMGLAALGLARLRVRKNPA
jgi:hypothetical protein